MSKRESVSENPSGKRVRVEEGPVPAPVPAPFSFGVPSQNTSQIFFSFGAQPKIKIDAELKKSFKEIFDKIYDEQTSSCKLSFEKDEKERKKKNIMLKAKRLAAFEKKEEERKKREEQTYKKRLQAHEEKLKTIEQRILKELME